MSQNNLNANRIFSLWIQYKYHYRKQQKNQVPQRLSFLLSAFASPYNLRNFHAVFTFICSIFTSDNFFFAATYFSNSEIFIQLSFKG